MRRTFLVLVASALACAGVAWADDYTGATGGNYNTAANWSGGVVPADPSSAYIRNGATVTLDAAMSAVPMELWVGGPSDPARSMVAPCTSSTGRC